MRSIRLFPVVALLLLLGACSDGGTEPRKNPSLNGTWTATAGAYTLTLDLAEANTSVTGTGTLAAGGGSIPLDVVGTHTHPSVSMTFSSPGFQNVTFQGQFTNDTTIVGVLNGAGFSDYPLTFTRQ